MNNILRFLMALVCLALPAQNIDAQNGVVHDLKIQGNKRLKSAFIKKIASVKKGTILDSLAIAEDMIRLKRLPSVSHVSYQVYAETENQYTVLYNIVENFTLIPSVSVYTTDNDEFAYRLGLYEFNLLGRNIIFGGFYQMDVYSSYALNFRAPYLFSNRLGLALNFQDLTTQEPVFFDDGMANYKYRNKSAEIMALFQFNLKNKLDLGLNYFVEDYTFKGENVDNRPELNVHKWMLKGIYDYNKLDYFYYFVSGLRSQLNVQYVTSKNAMVADFFIGWNDFFYFKRLGEKGNWATRMRVGFSTNDKTPFAPFSVDNNVNIRGVGNTIDRGTGTVVVNTEFRQTLFEKKWFVLQGNAFIDAGSWRNAGGDFSDFTKKKNIKVYPGLGLRLMHKEIYNAVFRIDYGYGITPNASKGFVIGIGQYF